MTQDSTVALLSTNLMPVIGLGTWQFDQDVAENIADALASGWRMIDTSGDYGSQPGIADGIKKSGKKREDFYIVTKVEEDENAYESAKHQVAELGLDYADLILIHRPPVGGNGEKLWQGLIKAKKEGVTRDIGVSNYSTDKILALIKDSGEIPVVNQIEWSPFGHSSEMLSFCRQHQIILQAYSPLTRNQRLGEEILLELGTKYHKTPAQILLRWNLQLGTVPLPKANQQIHRKENIDVFGFELSEDDMATLTGLNEKYSALGSLPYD